MKRMAGHLILNLGKNLPKTMFYVVARWAFPSLKVKERAFPNDKNGCGPKKFSGGKYNNMEPLPFNSGSASAVGCKL